VGVDVVDLRISEQTFDRRFDIRAFDEVRVDDHVRRVECAQGDHAGAQNLRTLVDPVVRLAGALEDEDRVACTIGRVGGLMLVVDQDDALARFGVAKLDAVGKARLRVSDLAFRAARGEFVVGHAEQ
jgi:hypothetical protein